MPINLKLGRSICSTLLLREILNCFLKENFGCQSKKYHLKIFNTIFSIRFRQGLRMLKDIGWVLLVLVLPLLLVFVLRGLEFGQEKGDFTLGWIVLFLLFITHIGRNDFAFIKQLQIKPFQLFAVEYSVLMVPFSLLVMIALGHWKDALLLQFGALLISMIPIPGKLKWHWSRYPSLQWFPLKSFEWRCAIRQYWYVILPIYLGGLFFSKFVAVPLVAIIVLAYFAAMHYDSVEPKEMVEIFTKQGRFVWEKIKTQWANFTLFIWPLYLVFLIWHYKLWYILLAAILIAHALMALALFYKYGNYFPGRFRVAPAMIVGVFSIFLFNPLGPILFPAILIYLIYLGKKAVKNMNFYYAED